MVSTGFLGLGKIENGYVRYSAYRCKRQMPLAIISACAVSDDKAQAAKHALPLHCCQRKKPKTTKHAEAWAAYGESLWGGRLGPRLPRDRVDVEFSRRREQAWMAAGRSLLPARDSGAKQSCD
ncbi:predicted protein [Coccidioides posadasii C735 delta SOWgp]|uniref:Uncharacterized protein n=1 Tax=Coccidioides posadasii (strain C735) TaxID=222929 RepID=C5P2J9_COCP7|nr:predicted protein [Coccidioides posadasii C735 delta SOWgp]EER29102.1 predicted protein [Coccidioides posadasii C735 delta SOWgp]|eukprot:XP_003071247.1 predicted protein [Coccidioides posadasii C735 delta SOWgp]